jgi:hypothetical protein
MTRLSNNKAEHSIMLCGFDSWQRLKRFLHSTTIPVLGPTHSLVQWTERRFSEGEADHSFPSVPGLRIHGGILLLHLYAFIMWTGTKLPFFIRWAIRTGGCAHQHSAALYNYVLIHHTQTLRTWISLCTNIHNSHALSLRTNIHNSHALSTSTASGIVFILFAHHLQKFPNVSQLCTFVHSTNFLRYILIYCQCPRVQSVHLHVSGLLQHADGMI